MAASRAGVTQLAECLLPKQRLGEAHIGLFTTYKLTTGSMFAKMRQPLAGKISAVGLELRSRTGHLSERDKSAIDRFIAGA